LSLFNKQLFKRLYDKGSEYDKTNEELGRAKLSLEIAFELLTEADSLVIKEGSLNPKYPQVHSKWENRDTCKQHF